MGFAARPGSGATVLIPRPQTSIDHPEVAEMAQPEREARLQDLTAGGWTTEFFVEFWAEPDLKWVSSIVTDDVVGYWPGGKTVLGKAEYMQALEELLALSPRSLPRGARAYDE